MAVIGLGGLAIVYILGRFVVWPPRQWVRWRHRTRPVRKALMPWRYKGDGKLHL